MLKWLALLTKYYKLKSSKNVNVKTKIFLLFTLILSFALIYYFFCEDMEFSGINKVQEIIKEMLIQKEVEKKVDEKVKETDIQLEQLESFYGTGDKTITELIKEKRTDRAIEETTDVIEKDIKKTELTEDKVKPNRKQKFIDRLYYSMVTSTTVGYGDIYPVSNKTKLLTMFQLALVFIVIFM